MRALIGILLCGLMVGPLAAQLPNATFGTDQGKHWKGPAFWYGDPKLDVSLTNDAQEGATALRMRAGAPGTPTELYLSGDSLAMKKRKPEVGFPINRVPNSLEGWYKLPSGPSKTGNFRLEVVFTRTSVYGTDTLAVGDLALPPTPVYRPFRVRIQNLGPYRLPDRMYLRIVAETDCEDAGTDCGYLYLDDLVFEGRRKRKNLYRPKPPVSAPRSGGDH